MPSLALIITTHERPDALATVLDSVARQREAPTEIVIADDGSGAATHDLIAEFSKRCAVTVRVVRQPHAGFRVARLRNLAIAATCADYLVFVDGDMRLQPQFIAEHTRLARRGWFTQGVRIHANATLTRRLLDVPATPLTLLTRGLGGLRRIYLVNSPVAAAFARRLANALIAVKACNFAAWRDDLVRVNGFNEAFEGWGPEDKELAVRLRNAGVRRQTLMFGGIAVHLHHARASRESLPTNRALLEATLRNRLVRTERGLDSHIG